MPAKLPSEIKKLKGTLQKSRTNQKEPKPEVVLLSPPPFLGSKAKKAFKELARITANMRILAESDAIALTMLCDAWAEWRDARDYIKKNGTTYKTVGKNGDVMYRAHPEVAIAADAFRRVTNLLSQFGLTPSSRANVEATPENDNYFDVFGE